MHLSSGVTVVADLAWILSYCTCSYIFPIPIVFRPVLYRIACTQTRFVYTINFICNLLIDIELHFSLIISKGNKC